MERRGQSEQLSPQAHTVNQCRRYTFYLLVAIFLAVFSGCAAMGPLIAAYSDSGVSKSDRVRLLNERVKDFQDGFYWGRPGLVLGYAEEEAHKELRKMIRDRKKNERLVDSEIDFVEFSDSAFDATVDIRVRYYQVPFYVVRERVERQKWRFHLGSGWKYVTQEAVIE